MSYDPTSDLKANLNDILDDLSNIPPSERGVFQDMKNSLKTLSDEKRGKVCFFVKDLSNEEDVRYIEEVLHDERIIEVRDQNTKWDSGALYYYVACEVEQSFYEEVRGDQLEKRRKALKTYDSLYGLISRFFQLLMLKISFDVSRETR